MQAGANAALVGAIREAIRANAALVGATLHAVDNASMLTLVHGCHGLGCVCVWN